jgi:hypothetical protein
LGDVLKFTDRTKDGTAGERELSSSGLSSEVFLVLMQERDNMSNNFEYHSI